MDFQEEVIEKTSEEMTLELLGCLGFDEALCPVFLFCLKKYLCWIAINK